MSDNGLLGAIGFVSLPVPADGPGEVVLTLQGMTQCFAAWADAPVPKHSRVVVVDVRSARSVTVSPLD